MEHIRQGRHIQEQLACKLNEEAGVAIGKCGMEEIQQFQEVLRDYEIYVISQEHFTAIIYYGA